MLKSQAYLTKILSHEDCEVSKNLYNLEHVTVCLTFGCCKKSCKLHRKCEIKIAKFDSMRLLISCYFYFALDLSSLKFKM